MLYGADVYTRRLAEVTPRHFGAQAEVFPATFQADSACSILVTRFDLRKPWSEVSV